jgi:hypothetical protein|tara:strand:+ start:293 stop:619 length:327 start_codon:yes stop_codon:yes gene_type:complete
MGVATRKLIPDWRENSVIARMLKSNLVNGSKVVSVHLKVDQDYPTQCKKYAEVVYKIGDKLYRTEFKLRDDRHWETRRKRNAKNKQGAGDTYFTPSDLLGKEGVSQTV